MGDRRGAGQRQPQRQRTERHGERPLHPVQSVAPEQPAVAERVGDRGEEDRQHHLQRVAEPGAAGAAELGEDDAQHDERGDAEGAQRDPVAAERAERDAGDDHQLPGGGHQPAGAVLPRPGQRGVEEPEADGRPERPAPRPGPQAAQHRGQSAAQGHQRHQRDNHEQVAQARAPHPGAAGQAHHAVEHEGGGEAGGGEHAEAHGEADAGPCAPRGYRHGAPFRNRGTALFDRLTCGSPFGERRRRGSPRALTSEMLVCPTGGPAPGSAA